MTFGFSGNKSFFPENVGNESTVKTEGLSLLRDFSWVFFGNNLVVW